MSEYMNNIQQFRKEQLREMIFELHAGGDLDSVKARFKEVFGTVTTKEIAEAEEALIASGVSSEEIQSLCDIHVSLFKGSILDKIIISEVTTSSQLTSTHPIALMTLENREIESLLQTIGKISLNSKNLLLSALEDLRKINLHYVKKENGFFPFLEKHNISAPTKVMWGVDNNIRGYIKSAIACLKEDNFTEETRLHLIEHINEMVFKEENILFPMAQSEFTEEEWYQVSLNCLDIGYFVKVPTIPYQVTESSSEEYDSIELEGDIILPSGSFTSEELHYIFRTLPFDLTFVDKNNKVRFFSQTPDHIFPRSTAILGRDVSNCHPPASVHIVEQIVADLQSGKKDHEDFWITMKNQFILIRYFAVRNNKNEYLGIIEITQNITNIQQITGEKRLADSTSNISR